MLGVGTARLQAQKLALCLPHPYLMGHFGILPAVPLLAFLLCQLLLKGRKMQLSLCPALPHPQYTYKSCSRNTETTARFGNPSYLPPQVPLLQRQLADLSYISCPSEQSSLSSCQLCIRLGVHFGPPDRTQGFLFPPSLLFLPLNSMKGNSGLGMA